MKARTCIAAVGATALLGTGGFVLPALASASTTTHTLKFIAVKKASVNFTKTTFGQQETDVNAKGKTIGYDELYFKATSKHEGHRERHARHDRGLPLRHHYRQLHQPCNKRQGDRRNRKIQGSYRNNHG